MEMEEILQRRRRKRFLPKYYWKVLSSARITLATVLFAMRVTGITGLHDVKVAIPKVVPSGGVATLGCRWILDDGETLYSVKWYRSRQEFYRYLPKEMPHTRVFTDEGINVDLNRSGEHEVVLQELTRNLTGHYGCEVSADAPSFHTEQTSSYMHIVDLPESDPVMISEKLWYSAGDILRANCSAPPADPPAEITWMINGRLVNGIPIEQTSKTPSVVSASQAAQTTAFTTVTIISTVSSSSHPTVNTNREDTVLKDTISPRDETDSPVKSRHPRAGWKRRSSTNALELRVLPDFFVKGKILVTCVASVHTIYSAKTELELHEEKPQIASVLGTRDTASGEATSFAPSQSVLPSTLMVYVIFSLS